MLHTTRIKLAFGFAAFSVAVGLLTQPVSAEAGMTVAPAFVRESISSANPVREFSIAVGNTAGQPLEIAVVVSAVALTNGQLVPVDGDGEGIVPAIQLSDEKIIVEAGKSKNVSIRVTNSDRLSPGGHYAAILFRDASGDSGQVTLHPAVSASLFITKEDGAIRSVTVAPPALGAVQLAMPRSVALKFETTGNVDVVPRASVSIVRDVALNVYAQGVANQGSAPLFPGKSITLQTPLESVKKAWLPGRYALLVRSRYDGQIQADEQAVWFWYIPVWSLIALCAVLGALGMTIRQAVRRKWVGRLYRRVAGSTGTTLPNPSLEPQQTSAAPKPGASDAITGNIAARPAAALDGIRPAGKVRRHSSAKKRPAPQKATVKNTIKAVQLSGEKAVSMTAAKPAVAATQARIKTTGTKIKTMTQGVERLSEQPESDEPLYSAAVVPKRTRTTDNSDSNPA